VTEAEKTSLGPVLVRFTGGGQWTRLEASLPNTPAQRPFWIHVGPYLLNCNVLRYVKHSYYDHRGGFSIARDELDSLESRRRKALTPEEWKRWQILIGEIERPTIQHRLEVLHVRTVKDEVQYAVRLNGEWIAEWIAGPDTFDNCTRITVFTVPDTILRTALTAHRGL
jgi:hypothetical protein